jgi:hypothetical protein
MENENGKEEDGGEMAGSNAVPYRKQVKEAHGVKLGNTERMDKKESRFFPFAKWIRIA